MSSLFHRLCIIVLFLFITCTLAKGQSKEVTYYNEYWQPIKKAQAMYYRTVTPQNGKYLVRDFYAATDTLQMEAECSSTSPKLIQHGAATFYHKNGNIERTGVYADNLPVGLHKSYYTNGNPLSERIYKGENELISQYWSASGEPYLVNGTGVITESDKWVSGPVYIEITDSVQMRSYTVTNSDTIYHYTQSPMEYQGGMEAFYQGVGKAIIYPKTARRNGVEGRVFIKFVINEFGQVTDASVVKGIGSGCDEQALNACLGQKKWLPGKYKNKAVKMQVVLPVIFKLG